MARTTWTTLLISSMEYTCLQLHMSPCCSWAGTWVIFLESWWLTRDGSVAGFTWLANGWATFCMCGFWLHPGSWGVGNLSLLYNFLYWLAVLISHFSIPWKAQAELIIIRSVGPSIFPSWIYHTCAWSAYVSVTKCTCNAHFRNSVSLSYRDPTSTSSLGRNAFLARYPTSNACVVLTAERWSP